MFKSASSIDWKARGTAVWAFGRFAGRHFLDDRCLRVAASLSYTSLLALVPLMAVVFAVLAEVPFFQGMRGVIQAYIFDNMLPDAGANVADAFNSFIDNARNMGRVALAGLAVVAILLFNTIVSAINVIFRVQRHRPVWKRLALFVGVLVLGPVVVAASFALAGYMLALTRGLGGEVLAGPLGLVTRAMPALMMIAGLTIFYWAVPNRTILWRDAVLGGLAGGVLFSLLRWGFGLYLLYFPTYQVIYGALSAVPVFLLWMYLSWAVVLIGGVVVAARAEWRVRELDREIAREIRRHGAKPGDPMVP